jgi:hypothetical protein
VISYAGYEVWRGDTPFFDPNNPSPGMELLASVPPPTGGNELRFVDSPVAPGVNVFYFVLGIDAGGGATVFSNHVGYFRFDLVIN